MQWDWGGLGAIPGAGIIGSLVSERCRLFGRYSGARRSSRRVTGAFDQASEIWWWRDCDEILAGSQPGDPVFTEIVRTLRPSLLPVAVPLKESLAQHCHLGLGQRIAVFIHD